MAINPNPNPGTIPLIGTKSSDSSGSSTSNSGSGGSTGGSGGGFPPRGPGPRFPRREFPTQNKDEHRINERIRVPQVRLIDHLGNQVGVVATPQALQMARDAGLDLVEISPTSNPPVCKILDYGKFKYEKKKKEHEAKKKQVVVKVKEIQLRPNTDDHDVDYKTKNIMQFLEEGDKAKITIMFRGREVAYVDQGYKIMAGLVEMTKDIAVVEAPAKLEGKKLIMILAPSKKSGK
jgi:translation initiation factor IF-3